MTKTNASKGRSCSVRAVWREDVCDADELRSAYVRFMWQRRELRRPLRYWRWVPLVLVAGSSAAFAAGGMLHLAANVPAAQSAAAPAVRMTLDAHSTAGAETAPSEAPAREQVTAANTVAPAPERAPIRSFGADVARNRASPVVSADSRAAEAPQEQSSAWERAARGLRDGDVPKTEGALREIEHSSRAEDAEAAQLIRAQLFLKLGRMAAAAALLRQLSTEAASPLLRKKAAMLLLQTKFDPE
jgi:hypothetical protein